jgi:NADH:ubiquinone oxidoreductase subunit 5 (subunit L)/multisubunit Na+/H+ antiporter MnhA subunit
MSPLWEKRTAYGLWGLAAIWMVGLVIYWYRKRKAEEAAKKAALRFALQYNPWVTEDK